MQILFITESVYHNYILFFNCDVYCANLRRLFTWSLFFPYSASVIQIMPRFSLLNIWAMLFVVATLQVGHLWSLPPALHTFVQSLPRNGSRWPVCKAEVMVFLRLGYKGCAFFLFLISLSLSLTLCSEEYKLSYCKDTLAACGEEQRPTANSQQASRIAQPCECT